MKRLLFVLALLCSQLSYAATKPSFTTVPFNQTGNAAQIAQPGASLTAFPGVGNISPTSNSGWYQAGNYGVAPAASGTTMQMGIDGSVNFSGVKYPWQAAYAVPKSSLLTAVASLFCTTTVTCAAIAAAPYVLDWLTKAGGRVDSAGTGLERRDIDACTTAPCYEYMTQYSTTYYNPKRAACNFVATKYPNGATTGTVGNYCQGTYTNNFGVTATYNESLTPRSVAPSPLQYLPSSMNDISPYMVRSDVNPDGRVVSELLDKGADLVMPLPTVTGPTSVAGPITTTTNADSTKSTQQTTYNFNTSGNTINNTGSTTTTNNYNTSNVITSTSSVNRTTVATDPTPDPCDANPTRAGCAKLGDAPTTEKLSKTTQAVNVVAQTFAGGGSCPPPVNFTLSVGPIRGSYGFSYSPLCNALLLIRGVILALAALMAAYILADSFKV